MKTFAVANFKGINGPLTLDLSLPTGEENCNLVIYSENGGGKTSLTEALRIAFLNDEFIDLRISPSVVDMHRIQEISTLWSSLLHDASDPFFKLVVNGNETFSNDGTNTVSTHDICILCRHDLIPSSRINIKDIIRKDNFKLKGLPIGDIISEDNITLVIDETNKLLKEYFFEKYSVVASRTGTLFSHRRNSQFRSYWRQYSSDGKRSCSESCKNSSLF